MSARISRDRVLASLPPLLVPLVEGLAAKASAAQADLYLVGGPVRDILLGRNPRDIDLLVVPSADAGSIARSAAPREAQVVEHGRFGTLRIQVPEGAIDLAGARTETYARPGALPKVRPGTLDEDLLRRDFTFNTLAISLTERGGKPLEVKDVCTGVEDLRAGRLRVLHPESFHDDGTRILRAARLLPRLGFSLTRPTHAAIRKALADDAFAGVSGDRLRREFEKLFGDVSLGLDPVLALRLLARWGALSCLEAGLDWPKSAAAPMRRLGKALADPPWRTNRFRPWVAGLSVWLAPLKPALRRRVMERLSIRGDAEARIAGFGQERGRILRQLGKARGRGAIDRVLSGTGEETLLALYACSEPLIRRRILRWAAEDRSRRAPLSGDDLLQLGLEGPALGKALATIRAAHLDGAIANREEATALAVEWARRHAARSPGRKQR